MVSGHTTSRRATGPDGEALRREAEILERARHPGVVELVAATTLDGATELLIADPRMAGAFQDLGLPPQRLAVGSGRPSARRMSGYHDKA